MPLEPGLSASVDHVVTDADTAIALGSGDVAVLGTPRVLALLEQATVAAVTDELAAEETTVGARVELDHLLPTPVGRRVTARAQLVEVDGRRLAFAVTLQDGERLAASGVVRRAVVERTRFA